MEVEFNQCLRSSVSLLAPHTRASHHAPASRPSPAHSGKCVGTLAVANAGMAIAQSISQCTCTQLPRPKQASPFRQTTTVSSGRCQESKTQPMHQSAECHSHHHIPSHSEATTSRLLSFWSPCCSDNSTLIPHLGSIEWSVISVYQEATAEISHWTPYRTGHFFTVKYYYST